MQLVLAGRSIYPPLSMRSQLGRLIWDLMAWGFVKKCVSRVEEGFGGVVSDDFSRVLSEKERYCEGIEFFL